MFCNLFSDLQRAVTNISSKSCRAGFYPANWETGVPWERKGLVRERSVDVCSMQDGETSGL